VPENNGGELNQKNILQNYYLYKKAKQNQLQLVAFVVQILQLKKLAKFK
jgi:hypothetical protein